MLNPAPVKRIANVGKVRGVNVIPRANLIKIQTVLPNFDDKLDYTTGWKGVEPVQQVSAQPIEHESNYLQGKYPPEYWSMVGNDFSLACGMCGSVSGAVPTSVGQATLKVDDILVGGNA